VDVARAPINEAMKLTTEMPMWSLSEAWAPAQTRAEHALQRTDLSNQKGYVTCESVSV